jgi:hypothetical protein
METRIAKHGLAVRLELFQLLDDWRSRYRRNERSVDNCAGCVSGYRNVMFEDSGGNREKRMFRHRLSASQLVYAGRKSRVSSKGAGGGLRPLERGHAIPVMIRMADDRSRLLEEPAQETPRRTLIKPNNRTANHDHISEVDSQFAQPLRQPVRIEGIGRFVYLVGPTTPIKDTVCARVDKETTVGSEDGRKLLRQLSIRRK